jgi:hypothetical protein
LRLADRVMCAEFLTATASDMNRPNLFEMALAKKRHLMLAAAAAVYSPVVEFQVLLELGPQPPRYASTSSRRECLTLALCRIVPAAAYTPNLGTSYLHWGKKSSMGPISGNHNNTVPTRRSFSYATNRRPQISACLPTH